MIRNLVLVLGDQLDASSAAFDGFDKRQDAILQMEVLEEAAYIRQHKKRIVYFFSAMRHFCEERRRDGCQVFYSKLDDAQNNGSFAKEIRRWARELRPAHLIVLEPGDWRVRHQLEQLNLSIEFRQDRHFLCGHDAFSAFAEAHPKFILETFYRFMRKQHRVLLDERGKPVGGRWNFDTDNRAKLSEKNLSLFTQKKGFPSDAMTREVIALVERRFADHPGKLDHFDLPVTRDQALSALEDFVAHRLHDFGRYQDAMLGGEAFLFHSALSGPLNLHLLNPKEVIDAALNTSAEAPLNSVEGFVRQILGWREFVRGIYWRLMPDYAQENALEAELPMPLFYWTGDTDMRCLAEAIRHTIEHAYAHHIERLMVLGLFCLLLGVKPYDVHRWHMSMFWDAIDWVSLPNTLGMSQFGDDGTIATKPYIASGAYIDRMSNHCSACRYDPKKALGEDACPFTTLYWDFLARHQSRFSKNQRMTFAYKNLARKTAGDIAAIRRQADQLKAKFSAQTFQITGFEAP
jgi:deoxyribodipyrimidine photolyase-related protein